MRAVCCVKSTSRCLISSRAWSQDQQSWSLSAAIKSHEDHDTYVARTRIIRISFRSPYSVQSTQGLIMWSAGDAPLRTKIEAEPADARRSFHTVPGNLLQFQSDCKPRRLRDLLCLPGVCPYCDTVQYGYCRRESHNSAAGCGCGYRMWQCGG